MTSSGDAERVDPLPYENHRQNQATQNILAASLEQCQAVCGGGGLLCVCACASTVGLSL